jgi:hypothetical protein
MVRGGHSIEGRAGDRSIRVNESGGERSKIVQEPTLINSEKTAGAAPRSASDTEIAPLAYKLWQGKGCPIVPSGED